MRKIRLLAALLMFVVLTAQTAFPQTYTTTPRFANARSCPRTSCSVVVSLPRGSEITVTGTATGSRIQGSRVWLQFSYQGTEAYIHSRLATPSGTAPDNDETCPDTAALCSEMTCEQAYACLNGGMTRLDRDHDGVPCEDICPGG